MNKHSRKSRHVGAEPDTADEDNRQSSPAKRKETAVAPDTDTEIGKAEQLGERFKKPA